MKVRCSLRRLLVSCCRKKDARVWSLGKLQELDGDAVVYFGVERLGSERRVNVCERR